MFLVNGQRIQLFNMKNELYTIGVEEEYMICDHNGNLVDKADLLMNLVKKDYLDRFSYELLLSEIESNTSINNTLKESISEVLVNRNILKKIGSRNDFVIGISGTHPTALPGDQKFVNNESYNWVSNQLKYLARCNGSEDCDRTRRRVWKIRLVYYEKNNFIRIKFSSRCY